MLQIHCHAAATSMKRTLALIRAIALRFVIAAVANIGGTSSIVPQPAYGESICLAYPTRGRSEVRFVARE